MRPDSHKEQIPDKRCGNCKFAHVFRRLGDLLCFHGDDIKLEKWSWKHSPDDIKTDVIFKGQNIEAFEADEYSTIWAGRIVDDTDICEEYVQK